MPLKIMNARAMMVDRPRVGPTVMRPRARLNVESPKIRPTFAPNTSRLIANPPSGGGSGGAPGATPGAGGGGSAGAAAGGGAAGAPFWTGVTWPAGSAGYAGSASPAGAPGAPGGSGAWAYRVSDVPQGWDGNSMPTQIVPPVLVLKNDGYAASPSVNVSQNVDESGRTPWGLLAAVAIVGIVFFSPSRKKSQKKE